MTPPSLPLREVASLRGATSLPLLVIALSIGYFLILKPIYNVFFHPLRNYSGPKLWAATRIPYQLAYTSGVIHKRMLELYDKYGDVVRIAPNELAYRRPDAWQEIMGHRKVGGVSNGENSKEPIFYQPNRDGIFGANRNNHSRYRRILSSGFSSQSVIDQEPLIGKYIDLFIQRLHENSSGGINPLNLVAWFNYTTFDVIGDLTLGEPFNCLVKSNYHPWISLIFASIKQQAILFSVRRLLPCIDKIIATVLPGTATKQAQHMQLVKANVDKRLAMADRRPDFMQSMLDNGKSALRREEIDEHANVLLIAGSETTATALSASIFFLCKHPEAMARLIEEVRQSFANESEISILSTQKLKYVLAVLDEAMRLYPPAPSSFPRITGSEGEVICGQYVPKGTILDIFQWPMYRDPKNFALPNEFHPERWLGEDPRFVNDRKEGFQPFSFGRRNCIGKNLAYAEMRLIMARLFWNFDLKLAEDSLDWDEESRVYNLWEKGPLHVHLTPRATKA